MAYFPSSLTMQDAASSLQPGLDAIRGGSADIDLSRMERFDSAAVAALLVWRRAAQSAGLSLRIASVPAGLQSLADLYGVAELLKD
jgi:phospholipid transport system transporter-binding protein